MRKENDVTNGRPGHHLSNDELSALRDGFLSAPDRQAHLDECPACRHELAALESIGTTLKALGQAPLPPGLDVRVRARLGESAGGGIPAWLGFWTRPLGVAAALVLLAASILTAERLIDRPQDTSAGWLWAAGFEAGTAAALTENGLDPGVDFLAPAGVEPGAAPGESLGGRP